MFLGCLALWGGASAFAATLLRNFAPYAAALAGYTAAIVAGDLLGPTGGSMQMRPSCSPSSGEARTASVPSAPASFLGLTDLGGAPRRLAALFAATASEIAGRFTGTLTVAGANFDETQRVRWEFVRRVIALDPVIDEAIGESSQLRYHSPVLKRAVDGLFTALVGWRAVANHLVRLSDNEARREVAAVLESVPQHAIPPLAQRRPEVRLTDNRSRDPGPVRVVKLELVRDVERKGHRSPQTQPNSSGGPAAFRASASRRAGKVAPPLQAAGAEISGCHKADRAV